MLCSREAPSRLVISMATIDLGNSGRASLGSTELAEVLASRVPSPSRAGTLPPEDFATTLAITQWHSGLRSLRLRTASDQSRDQTRLNP